MMGLGIVNLKQSQIQNVIDSFSQQVSHDFDEQASFLKGWNQAYNQISSGKFQGLISEVHIKHLSLFLEYTSQSLYQQGHLGLEDIAIGVPLDSIETGMFCGTSCRQGTVHVYSGQDGFEFISPPDLMIGLIVINRHCLMQLLSADDQYFLNLQFRKAHVAKIAYPSYSKLVRFLKSTFEILKTHPQMIANSNFKDELMASAIELITESLLVRAPQSQGVLLSKSWQVVANTREIINMRQDNPISVVELCESLEMSRRNLQYHFEQAMQTSPIAYLRAERLNGVRRMLKNSHSVTYAATYWGFWHFGHFSQEYKKMFGELPSATFKRYHSPR
jgi:AraC family transcriptional regulator, ethanolamine operon transcriptional activator